MKKHKLLRAMSLADDKYVAEADPRKTKRRPAWQKWATIAACICLMVTALNLVLFLPYNTDPPDVSRYADSDYYPVIQQLNALTYKKPAHKNNFESLMAGLENMVPSKDMVGEEPNASGDAMEGNGGQSYAEVTDNQVAGVIEGDIIKRSDKYIYYMHGANLYVYSIEKEDSKLLFSCSLDTYDRPDYDVSSYYTNEFEFYLSEDCSTLTVIMPFYAKNQTGWAQTLVDIVSLDVTDPTKTHETNRVTVTGGYLSSRMVDGKLLLMTNLYVRNPDFSDESTFLPQINVGNGFESIPADSIISPETLSSPRYTTVVLLDEKTLAVQGNSAFLSYSQEVYVSRDSVYATSQYTDVTETNDGYKQSTVMTEISRLSYENGTLTHMGSTAVKGSVKNQYSLDEYEDILRVVTTTRTQKYKQTVWSNGDVASSDITNLQSTVGASLYCIDINTWETVAKVENFAPEGETVESVRFDGDAAYVCTAVVVQLTDPVFFFDLSDLDNITYKDTGVIEGYSSSLVNWGDGYLLGIGYGDSWELKIEVYEESENGVVSVCAYELAADFSQDYKAYYIDRENRLIGLGIVDYDSYYQDTAESNYRYIVLHFDDFELREVVNVDISAHPDYCRGFYLDGYMYIVGQDNFKVVSVWDGQS